MPSFGGSVENRPRAGHVSHVFVDHHHASTRRLPLEAFHSIQIHVHVNLHLVVCPCPHHPRHLCLLLFRYQAAFFSLFQLPCVGFVIFVHVSFAAYCTSDLSKLMRFSVVAKLLNFFLCAASSTFASSSCPISSGLTAALLTVCEASAQSQPFQQCLAMFATRLTLQPFLCSPQTSSQKISTSRTSPCPLPRMPRTLDVAPFAHHRSHLPQLRLRGYEREVVAMHNDTDVSSGVVEYR